MGPTGQVSVENIDSGRGKEVKYQFDVRPDKLSLNPAGGAKMK